VEEFWDRFRLDPRAPANAGLRAADADREVVRSLLADAYADGRLTREEHDARLTAVLQAVTLADLPPVVADLAPASGALERVPAGALEVEARAAYARRLRDDLGGLLTVGLIVLVIWLLTDPGGFFWPAFPILAVGIKPLGTVLHRADIIAKERAKLERRRMKELEAPERPEDDA
jgi:hypothetical protein